MCFAIIRNKSAQSGDVRQTILTTDGARDAMREISSWPGYAVTPLHNLAPVARGADIRSVLYKDESKRFDLQSFKALGGAYAVGRLLQRRVSAQLGRPVSTSELVSGTHHAITKAITVVSATDGNHGRSVAAGAMLFGCRCVIIIHADVSADRAAAIEARGAEVVRIAGSYDDSAREAARLATGDGWALVADTSSYGGDTACIDVMNGYTVMVDEAINQIASSGDKPPTHTFVQGGVGGLAAAVCAQTFHRYGERAPIIVVVEPDRADCLFQSAKNGTPSRATGNMDTVMAGLACGEVSGLAWEVLSGSAEFFMKISDDDAIAAMRLLADEKKAGARIVAGESAGAGLAGMLAVARDAEARRTVRLDHASSVLIFGTEGATDFKLYESLVGHPIIEAVE